MGILCVVHCTFEIVLMQMITSCHKVGTFSVLLCYALLLVWERWGFHGGEDSSWGLLSGDAISLAMFMVKWWYHIVILRGITTRKTSTCC